MVVKTIVVSQKKAMAESQVRSMGVHTKGNDYFGGTLVSGCSIEKGD